MGYLIDGNNVAAARGTDRAGLRAWLLDALRHAKARVRVVFDGPPPPGSPGTEALGRLDVRYSGSSSADDLLVSMAGRGDIAVTADRELAARLRAKGATIMAPSALRFRRADSKRRAARRARLEPAVKGSELADWEAYFAAGRVDEDD